MSLILNIDTATETASVSLAENGIIIQSMVNMVQKDHAAFVHPAIKNILLTARKDIKELEAIAVTAGPGSYTGIRVCMASAKGLCISLNVPFITINTLELLAKDVIMHYPADHSHLFCPMIDARRMEVYTAVYDLSLHEILKPCALILDAQSYHQFSNDTLIVVGSGKKKYDSVVKFRNFKTTENVNIPAAMAFLTNERYMLKSFTDVVYSEPLYLKEFYSGT